MRLPRVAISLRGIIALACLALALPSTVTTAQTAQHEISGHVRLDHIVRGEPLIVTIHPNPPQQTASVVVEHLPVGTWTLEVIEANGKVCDRQAVEADGVSDMLRAIDVRGLADGYYIVRVRNTNGVIGTCPIVIKR